MQRDCDGEVTNRGAQSVEPTSNPSVPGTDAGAPVQPLQHPVPTVGNASQATGAAPYEPVHVLSTHRIQSLEKHVDMLSNLELAEAARGEAPGLRPVCCTAVDTTVGKTLEAALGSLDISGRPQPSSIPRLQAVSEESAPEVPVFKVLPESWLNLASWSS